MSLIARIAEYVKQNPGSLSFSPRMLRAFEQAASGEATELTLIYRRDVDLNNTAEATISIETYTDDSGIEKTSFDVTWPSYYASSVDIGMKRAELIMEVCRTAKELQNQF